MNKESRAFLRHALATVAYRGAKAVSGSPGNFAEFRIGSGTRTPGEILCHVGDLLDWALSLARGKSAWHNSTPLPWEQEVERFFRSLSALDVALMDVDDLPCPPERIFQGPLADALAHVGQLALIRRLTGSPVKGENYFEADIAAGRVGSDQAVPRAEFK